MKEVIVVVKEYLGPGSFGEESDQLVHVAQAEEGVFGEGESQQLEPLSGRRVGYNLDLETVRLEDM